MKKLFVIATLLIAFAVPVRPDDGISHPDLVPPPPAPLTQPNGSLSSMETTLGEEALSLLLSMVGR